MNRSFRPPSHLSAALLILAFASFAFAEPPDKQQPHAPIQPSDSELEASKSRSFDHDIIPLLKSFCVDCHQESEPSGDLDIESLFQVSPLVVNRVDWINIIEQLKVRSMPPTDADQPTEEIRRQLVAWLTVAIEHFDYEQVRQAGYEPAKRLSHEEYNHTIRDLVGIDLRPADQFPADMSATSGFDNSANSLFMQPVNLERFASAAERVVELAYPDKTTTQDTKRSRIRLIGNSTAMVTRQSAIAAIETFASRAFRRPAESEELTSLNLHFAAQMRSGMSPYDALQGVIEVVLVSPSFLIRSERSGPESGVAYRVTDWELASRLSYFLWASMPDDELMRLAKSDQLHDAQVLEAQVDRMLKDPRSETLGTIFAAQWLGFAHLKSMQPDQIDNPWGDDALIESMEAESAMLINSMVRDNEPLERLIDADYTYLNEQLASHYKIRNVVGDQMRRVSLAESPRRGILGHGSILATTSFQYRASPVVRGNWILSELLGTPPPPPPPNVSEFDDEIADAKLTAREKLERHRENPNCYACHSQIDPLGFALEHFDWFGRHRRYRSRQPTVGTGQLPDGTSFKGLRELSNALVKTRLDDLSYQITRKMLSYALGRQLEYYDEATVRDLVNELETNDRRLQSLIHEIVQSETFQKRQQIGDPTR